MLRFIALNGRPDSGGNGDGVKFVSSGCRRRSSLWRSRIVAPNSGDPR
jgi:hypothetical protein